MADKRSAPSRLVYSTGGSGAKPASRPAARGDQGCRGCGASPCRCEPMRSLPAAEQQVRVWRDSSGRRGKTVTVAGPLFLTRADAAALLAGWKRLCGGGGTLRARRLAGGDCCFELEVQGDHADRLVGELQRDGYRVKRSGG